MVHEAERGGRTGRFQETPSTGTAAGAHSEYMPVVTQLLAAVGAVTAVVLLVLMAAVPLLVDLPLERKGR